MKISSTLILNINILLLSLLGACIDSLSFFGVRPTRKSFNRGFRLYEKSAPHPPDNPPPNEVFEKGVYFANPADNTDIRSDDGEEDNATSTDAKDVVIVNGESTEYAPLRIGIDDETKELSIKAARNFFETVIVSSILRVIWFLARFLWVCVFSCFFLLRNVETNFSNAAWRFWRGD
jgi:hypothetical protein